MVEDAEGFNLLRCGLHKRGGEPVVLMPVIQLCPESASCLNTPSGDVAVDAGRP